MSLEATTALARSAEFRKRFTSGQLCTSVHGLSMELIQFLKDCLMKTVTDVQHHSIKCAQLPILRGATANADSRFCRSYLRVYVSPTAIASPRGGRETDRQHATPFTRVLCKNVTKYLAKIGAKSPISLIVTFGFFPSRLRRVRKAAPRSCHGYAVLNRRWNVSCCLQLRSGPA